MHPIAVANVEQVVRGNLAHILRAQRGNWFRQNRMRIRLLFWELMLVLAIPWLESARRMEYPPILLLDWGFQNLHLEELYGDEVQVLTSLFQQYPLQPLGVQSAI